MNELAVPQKKRTGVPRPCAVCNREFRPPDSGSSQKFCSYACYGVSQRRTAKCAVCAKVFKPSRPGYETCGRACGTKLRMSRRVVDPMVNVRQRLAVFCCSTLARCLREKHDRTAALLGFTVRELKAHLEQHFAQGMSWANYGKKVGQWSIDHTRPISTFPPDAAISEINALSNLRPMWHIENCSKRNKWSQ